MAIPWFFATLGLSAYTNEREIKRAYALRLREIDQAADPAAFARLRDAYEAARAWCDRADDLPDAATPDDMPLPVSNATFPTTETSVEKARRLLDGFCRQVEDNDALHLEHALNAAFADLRLMQIEAAAAFQALLVDRLVDGSMPRRDRVFRAAWAYFAWNDVNHVASLGPQRHAWIDAVERQRRALLLSPAGQRVLALLEQAARDGALRPQESLRPAMADAAVRYPQLFELHVTSRIRETWAGRYGEKPPFSLRRAWKENWPLIFVAVALLAIFVTEPILELVHWVRHR